jgi:hypothetical protein
MPEETTKEQFTARAQIVRAFEASCQIDHPSDEERAFRVALMKRLAVEFGLKELRGASFVAPNHAGRPARS